MKYEAAYLYDGNNQFLGAVIKKINAPQLQSVNIWSDSDEEIEDFRKTLTGLNDEDQLRRFWPNAHDPEVGELVEDPEWEPLELHQESVPDWDNSTIVDDEFGGIDMEKSIIAHKIAAIPDPNEAQARYYKAQEIVARKRLEAARSS